MMQEITAHLFELVMLSGAGMGLGGVVAAGVYDLQAVTRRRRISAAARRLKRKSTQPLVTVIVYTRNDAETVTACLESVRHSLYHNYDLVVADDASQDGTRQAVRHFMRKHPRFTMYFYAKRKRSPLQEVIRQAYQKSRKGEIVVTLAASSRPSRSFLGEAVARFSAEPDLISLSANECRAVPLTITDLVPEVTRAMGHVLMKCLSLLRVRRDRVDLNGVYRSNLIVSGARANARYEEALLLPVTRRERQPDVVSRCPLIQTVFAVALLLLMSYAMVMAASLVSYVPLLLGWSFMTAGSLAVVWSDEGISLVQKLQLTLSATLIYFLLYVTLLSFLLEQITKSTFVLSKSVSPCLAWYIRRRAIP